MKTLLTALVLAGALTIPVTSVEAQSGRSYYRTQDFHGNRPNRSYRGDWDRGYRGDWDGRRSYRYRNPYYRNYRYYPYQRYYRGYRYPYYRPYYGSYYYYPYGGYYFTPYGGMRYARPGFSFYYGW